MDKAKKRKNNKVPVFERELSQLEFNYRVLELAQESTTPLLERLRYLFITNNNLDEFFEIRVANLKQIALLEALKENQVNGYQPKDILAQINERSHQLVKEIFQTYNTVIYPELAAQGICFLKQHDWNDAQRRWIAEYFEREILPVISPIALDVAHPFPRLVNKNLNFIVSLSGKDAFGRDSRLAIVHAPRIIPRIIPVPAELKKANEHAFFLLTSMIKAHVTDLFLGMKVDGCYQFRIIRNSDLLLDQREVNDLPLALKASLIERRFGLAIRLDVEHDCPDELADYLLRQHDLTQKDLFRIDGQVNFGRLSAVLADVKRPDLLFKPFSPQIPAKLKRREDIFNTLKDHDLLLHHPYQSFEPVIDLVRQSTYDPYVVAIKQTLYRTNVDSAIVGALVEAARAGIEVTTVIELRARFDEEQNIELATRLQEAGAIVVYGIVGYKTHAKMLLVVRREGAELCRYVHLGTGNYHARTAKEYTDISLFTANADIGHDVQLLFQEMTGMGKVMETRRIWHAPFTLVNNFKKMINREIHHAKKGKKAHIMFKINAFTDATLVELLYEASQAGVKIDLLVRGMCALKPGVPGLSDNIKVRSIMGRFLEHSRVYYFYNDGDEEVFCSSADLMERNLYHRFEICFPILDKTLAKRIKLECLTYSFKDNCQSWALESNGSYKRVKALKKRRFSVQEFLLEEYTQSIYTQHT
ncbi:MAG: polyphosphate kinase 1 [Legionellales bacterium]|nr:polyphosphate kinase 1 [Legionellales bacterium]